MVRDTEAILACDWRTDSRNFVAASEAGPDR